MMRTETEMLQEKALLEAFVVNNQDLERLEAMLAEFNIFEAVGMTRQEIRHSHFLAFLLDPGQNHGLGDTFLKQWLKNVLIKAESPPVSPVDIDIAEFLASLAARDFAQHQLELYWNDDKRYFQFHAREWEQVPQALLEAGIEADDLPLLFEMSNEPNRLILRLCLALTLYDEPYPEPVCRQLLETAQTHSEIFYRPDSRMMKRWTWLHQIEFLSAKDYDGADLESLTPKIEAKWQAFLKQDLPQIRSQISRIDWSVLNFKG